MSLPDRVTVAIIGRVRVVHNWDMRDNGLHERPRVLFARRVSSGEDECRRVGSAKNVKVSCASFDPFVLREDHPAPARDVRDPHLVRAIRGEVIVVPLHRGAGIPKRSWNDILAEAAVDEERELGLVRLRARTVPSGGRPRSGRG